MAAECVNGSMMSVAELQWPVTKPPKYCLGHFFLNMVIADATVIGNL